MGLRGAELTVLMSVGGFGDFSRAVLQGLAYNSHISDLHLDLSSCEVRASTRGCHRSVPCPLWGQVTVPTAASRDGEDVEKEKRKRKRRLRLLLTGIILIALLLLFAVAATVLLALIIFSPNIGDDSLNTHNIHKGIFAYIFIGIFLVILLEIVLIRIFLRKKKQM